MTDQKHEVHAEAGMLTCDRCRAGAGERCTGIGRGRYGRRLRRMHHARLLKAARVLAARADQADERLL